MKYVGCQVLTMVPYHIQILERKKNHWVASFKFRTQIFSFFWRGLIPQVLPRLILLNYVVLNGNGQRQWKIWREGHFKFVQISDFTLHDMARHVNMTWHGTICSHYITIDFYPDRINPLCRHPFCCPSLGNKLSECMHGMMMCMLAWWCAWYDDVHVGMMVCLACCY